MEEMPLHNGDDQNRNAAARTQAHGRLPAPLPPRAMPGGLAGIQRRRFDQYVNSRKGDYHEWTMASTAALLSGIATCIWPLALTFLLSDFAPLGFLLFMGAGILSLASISLFIIERQKPIRAIIALVLALVDLAATGIATYWFFH